MMFTKQQFKFFDKAAAVAANSDFDRYHLGCIAVLKNKVIASASNKLKTHPLQKEYDDKYRQFNCLSNPKNMYSLHAEIACLKQLRGQDINYKDLELYIVRLRKDTKYGMARPCSACMNLIKSMGIKKIFYTTNAGFSLEIII